jgi:hypothetical protein
MGQAQSATLPSKEELLRRTKGGSDLVNELFRWMVSQTSIRDFYLMANPAQCKKYIMLTANVLNQVFYKIDVVPKEGPKGTIYFRKIDALNPQDKSSAMYKHREINCLRLAFLYVRIFQVFAALSLTILDVDPAMEQKLLGDISRFRDTDTIPLFAPRQRGGALDSRKPLPSSFQILRSVLSEIPNDTNFYKFVDTSIYLQYSSLGSDGSLPIRYDFSVVRDGRPAKGNIQGKILIESATADKITFAFFDLRLTIGSTSTSLNDTRISFNRRSIEDIYRDKGSRSIPRGLDYLFRKMAAGQKVEDEEEEEEEREDTYYNRARGPQRRDIADFTKDMGEVSQGLHTKILVDAFTRTAPPKAHCIARALQLVSDSGLQSQFPKEIYSHVCKAKFMSETKSLPPAGDRITKEDGIFALGQLFYDTLKEATPAISAATQEQYKAFVQKMKFVFEEVKDSKVGASDMKRTALDSVINKVPSSVCQKDSLDKTLKLTNRDMIRLLRDNIRKMVLYQVNHTANAVKILRKLFLLPVESGKALQIHPRVLKNGMEEVNAIAAEARELLVDYYSQCEILYRSGAEILASNKSLLTAI